MKYYNARNLVCDNNNCLVPELSDSSYTVIEDIIQHQDENQIMKIKDE